MRHLARWALALFAIASSACTFDQQTIGVAPAQVVVHAVLDPNAPIQEILVERTLTGAVSVREGVRYDPLDPINSGEGVPVVGAQVTIEGPDGAIGGFERRVPPSPYGGGRYEVKLGNGAGSTPVRPGARYTLTVRTLDGAIVRGTTTVPNARPATPNEVPSSFDRDRDTLRLAWAPVPGARTYGLRVETPFGPFLLFSDSTTLTLGGELRNFFAEDLQRLWIPGFRQTVTVFAVDANFFDYYRSRNDPFTGSGIINRLEGGIGFFGALALIESRTLDVTQQPKDATIEGEYEVSNPPPGPRVVDVFRLYVETKGPPMSLSGWYQVDRTKPARDGVAGARDGERIELEFLMDQDARRRRATFVGVQMGDSLVGAYNGASGRVVFRRRR